MKTCRFRRVAERFLLIDPSDIDHPPALNLFDPGIKRLETYTPREREMAFNSLVDIRLPKFDDDYVKDQFVWLQRPIFWWRMARDLAEAAEVIYRNYDRTIHDQKQGRRYRRKIMPGIWQGLFNPINFQPGHLLYSLAIENALKGILVGRDNDLINAAKLTTIITGTGHDLRQICKIGNIDLPEADLVLLDKLTATIKWAGRYPTPIRENDLMPADGSGKRYYAGLSYWSNDREDTRGLYRRLDEMLQPLLRDQFSEGDILEPEPPKRRKKKKG